MIKRTIFAIFCADEKLCKYKLVSLVGTENTW